MEARSATSVRHSSSRGGYICCGAKQQYRPGGFLEVRRKQLDQLRDIANTTPTTTMTMTTPSHGPKPYLSSLGAEGLWLRGIRNSTSLSSDYWLYDPDKDLWYGDSDDDLPPLQMYIIILPALLRAGLPLVSLPANVVLC